MSTAAIARDQRRRRHEDVRASVVAATIELAEQAPFNDLTVEEIARAAGISRTAFYFYFRDKQDLLMAAAADVADALYREADRWWGADGPPEVLVREAIAGVVAVYEQHADLLRVATEVSTYDPEVSRLWRGLVARFVVATADHIRAEQAVGRIGELEPDRTAEALMWMAERCCYVYLVSGERSSEELVESLATVWLRALYAAP